MEILAATPGDRAEQRGYTAIFGRDAAVCALGMAVSGDKLLEREAVPNKGQSIRHVFVSSAQVTAAMPRSRV